MKKELQSKDFRIGNLVLLHNNECEINLIDSVGIVGIKYLHLIDLKYIEPIPLTKVWLLKFGFPEPLIVERESSIIFNISGFWYKHDFVHELQNLYFALTGEELELKSDNP